MGQRESVVASSEKELTDTISKHEKFPLHTTTPISITKKRKSSGARSSLKDHRELIARMRKELEDMRDRGKSPNHALYSDYIFARIDSRSPSERTVNYIKEELLFIKEMNKTCV